MTALALHWSFHCRLSLVGASKGCCLVALCWLLISLAPLIVKRVLLYRHSGFSSCRSWAPEHRLVSCGPRAVPSNVGSSLTRDRTRVPCIGSHILNHWTTRCYAQVVKSPNDHQGAGIWCKSKRVFMTKLELGLPPLPTQRLRRGAPSFGLHCFYREYSGERVIKGVFRLKDYWLVTLFYRVVCGFLIAFFTSTVNHYFQGKSQR